MNKDQEDTDKFELQKLLREYDSNSGMASFVCSRAVELMSREDQEKFINGFCIPENLKILSISKHKLLLAKALNLTPSEEKKIDLAIPTLDRLLQAFTDYQQSRIDIGELRQKVRQIVEKPIPDTNEGLTKAFPHLIDALNFLATQPLSTKDSWDRLMDCVQMHDTLCRMKKICCALETLAKNSPNQITKPLPPIEVIKQITDESVDFLESFFKGAKAKTELQDHFTSLAAKLKDIPVTPRSTLGG